MGVSATAIAVCLVALPWPYSADDITHYQIARDSLREPRLLLDQWGRPGFTVLHMLPAQLGFMGCRIFSAILTLATALLVARSCRIFGRWGPALGILFFVFQPQTFHLADGALTETVFAFALALGLRFVESRRFTAAALAWSWAAISRFEGMAILPIFAIWLALPDAAPPGRSRPPFQTVIFRTLALGFFPFVWNLLLWIQSGFTKPFALLTENPFSNARQGLYGQGSFATFVASSMEIHGPVAAVLLPFGIWLAFKARDRLVPSIIVAFYALQSALWTFGLCRTGGYLRFFASIAPFVAITATRAAVPLLARFERRSRRAVALAGLVIAGLTVAWACCSVMVTHVIMDGPNEQVAQAVRVVREQGAPSKATPVLTDNCLAKMLLDGGFLPNPALALDSLTPEHLAEAPRGTLVLVAHFPGDPETSVPVADFYEPVERSAHRDPLDPERVLVHRLRGLLPGYEQLADCSLYQRWAASADAERWPYFVKVFRKLDGPR